MEENKTIIEGTLDQVIKNIEALGPEENNAEKYQLIYDGEHEILSRPSKTAIKNGKTVSVPTAKVVLDYQEDIVESAVAFLFGAPVTINKITKDGDEAFQFLTDTIEDIHFNSRNKQLARKLFVQTRAAKLYYIKNPDDKEKRSLASMVLSCENGEFIPVFENGSMTAFFRKYKVKEIVEGKPKEIEKCEIYTAEKIIYAIKTDAGWEGQETKNPFGKIPVVYYEQKFPEWKKVESIISSQELSFSKLIDTNDYFAKPKLKVLGKLANMPDKGEVGEILTMEVIDTPDGGKIESKAEYLTWDQRPESLKLQFESSDNYIYKFTRTADASFLNMSKASLGQLSGEALKMLFISPVVKSLNKQEQFDEMIKREINIIKSILATMETKYAKALNEMKVSITFNSILPHNIADVIQNLVTAVSGGVMSQETAIEQNPLVENLEEEKKRVKAENNNPLKAIAEPDGGEEPEE